MKIVFKGSTFVKMYGG